jgi:predicted esterase/predicted RNA-binding protein with TRAM domain
MKKIFLVIVSVCMYAIGLSQPNILNPADPIVNYNSSSPPATPPFGQMAKWVRTPRMNWDATSFKCYYFNGVQFRVKFPTTYQHNVADGQKYPVALFLHGLGERGTIYDNEYSLLHGGQTFRDRVNNGSFNGFLIYPQSQNGFWGTSYFTTLVQIIDSMAKYVKADLDRVFIHGLSSGGQGVWDFIAANPKTFSHAAPISAASLDDIPNIPNYIHLPLWMFTGDLDSNPAAGTAAALRDSIRNRGGNVKHTRYANMGHGVWNVAWADAGFVPYMNTGHKANPLVFFGRSEFCVGDPVSVKMGLTAGFNAYEWQKDGVTIPGATTNEITVTQFGTYRARFRRTATSAWSDWSPAPVVVRIKPTTQTPDIQIAGLRSNSVPAPDGSTTVPLTLPEGYASYEWRRVSDNQIVATSQVFDAVPGQYTATVTEQFGCAALPSPVFTVNNANGNPKPDPASGLTATGQSKTSIQLDWSDNPNPAVNETGFEIYRSQTAGGPYTLIAINNANVLSYLNSDLEPDTRYYYIVRAITPTGAAANSNEATGKTTVDNTPPTAPTGLAVIATSRNSVTLQWNPATDDVGVEKYDIFVDGQKSYTTTNLSFTVYNLSFGQSYGFSVRAIDKAGNASPLSSQVNAQARNAGLNYKLYNGTWNALPNFATLTPVAEGKSPNVNIGLRNRNDNFGFLWEGFITVPTTGTYTFETCSDDGSKLYIGNYNHTATALVNNDGLHGTQCRTGSISLTAGSHPIAITFFELGGGEAMTVWWRNNVGLARQQIPNSAFIDNVPPGGTAPAQPSNLQATVVNYKRVNLTWTDNSNNETGFQVFRKTSAATSYTAIGTVNANTTSFADSTVEASTTYQYAVQAVNQFGVSGFNPADMSGLNYDYYPGSFSVLPNFASLTPVASGNVPNVTLAPRLANDNFAFRFAGTITIPTTGSYTFFTTSDDGSKLYIGTFNNAGQVVNNDGLHGPQEASGTRTLNAGTYPIWITFFEQGGGEMLEARWQGPGIAKQLIPTSAFTNTRTTVTTPGLPAAPAAPTNLVTTALTGSTIKLDWNDNANNETEYEVWRSVNNNANFRLVAKVPAAAGPQATYTDTALFANVTYFYKVRAKGEGGFSIYTNESSATTLNSVPVLVAINAVVMRFDSERILNISATDADGDPITLNITNLPAFGVYQNTGNGTGTITLNPNSAQQGSYNITIEASDTNTGLASITVPVTVNSNYPPALNSIGNVSVNESSTASASISATDADGTTGLVLSAANLPSFATLVDNGDGTGSINFAPGFADGDTYNINVTVTDPTGATDTKTFAVTVNDVSPGETIRVNIQRATAAASPWNNVTGLNTSNLLNTNNVVTTKGLQFQTTAWNTWNAGAVTGNNSGVYPDNVIQDYYFFGIFGAPNTVDVSVTGLNPALNYKFTFFGSSAWTGVANNGSTSYTIGSNTVTLNVHNNSANTVSINNAVPNASGEITFTMSKFGTSPAGYLNAFEFESSFDDGNAPAKPKYLAAQTVPTGVRLTWKDVAFNESRYNIYRSIALNGSYTLLNPGASNANDTSYTDNTAASSTTYFYKVSAANANGESALTDAVSVTTGNKLPVLNEQDNLFVKAGNTINRSITVTDDAGDILTTTVTGLPSFATFTPSGNGNGTITGSTTNAHVGRYNNIIVTVADDKGGVVKDTFDITVGDASTNSIFVNFGSDGMGAPAPWNNMLGFPAGGKTITNLVNEEGNTTPVAVALMEQWTQTIDFGHVTGNNSGAYTDDVLRSAIYSSSTGTLRLRITGLATTGKKYNFVFMGSINAGPEAISNYSFGSQTVQLDARYNTDRTVQLNGLVPNASGEIIVNINKASTSSLAYLNAMVIQEYDNTTAILSPIALRAEPGSRTSVKLSWADRADNETGYQVWRSTALNGTYSLINTTDANATSFTNTSLTPNTKYYYQVRAVYASGQSLYSNIASAVTPNNIVYLHFTNQYPAPAPWNNTNVIPQVGDVYGNLKDDLSNNTGFAVNLLQAFNGEFWAGMNTGNNSGIYPDPVLISSYWLDNGQLVKLKVTQLNQALKYRLRFLASADWNYNLTTTYTVNGRTVQLNAAYNTTKEVNIENITPTGDGEIFIDVSTITAAQYGFLGALVIEGYADNGDIVLPSVRPSQTVMEETVVPAAPASNTAQQNPVQRLTEVVKGELQIKAMPNPFVNEVAFELKNIEMNSNVVMQLIDAQGRIVGMQQWMKVSGPVTLIRLDAASLKLQKGIYVARFTVNGKPGPVMQLIKSN